VGLTIFSIFPFLFLSPASHGTVLWSVRPPPRARSTAAATCALYVKSQCV
jgi:hypothetical protein